VADYDIETTADFPRRIGRYRVERLLGSGGFGDVFLAADDQLERRVAIKVPNERVRKSETCVSEYLAEARMVADLDHANVVPVYDLGSCEEYPFFVVSKYIAGSDLRKAMLSQPFSFEQILDMVATVADALQYAHKKGIVHRDIKPGNILVQNDGRIYLADFGLALAEKSFAEDYRHAGTPAYMSPEQARGEGHRIDGRSDIFSLGAVLYELVSRRRAFRGESIAELYESVKFHEPRPLRQFDETLPAEIDRICSKAMAKRANERYSTAYDFAADLRALATVCTTNSLSVASLSSTTKSPPSDESKKTSDTFTAGLLSDTPQHSAPSDPHLPVIVPKGLHAFDAHDADFFLELLPGARDRHGIPDCLRFWLSRVDPTNEDPFPVGMIYGPSGCGKSSLIKAGFLPRLPRGVLPVFVEATGNATESRILHGLQRAFPALDRTLELTETMAAIRRGFHCEDGHKIVLILDQFEQWLHAHPNPEQTKLVAALRQCDGHHIQTIILIRSDFWMAVTHFFRSLEVELRQGYNLASADLFSARHAETVLIAYGRALGNLPQTERLNDDQRAFIKQAVKDLTQNEMVICVRLAVYAEMMKHKSWTTKTLKQVGGFAGVGVAFLEESFGAHANPKHRFHEEAARAVLKSLLPETGTEISSQLKSYAELQQASLYAETRLFDELLHLLDSELRLVAPTDRSGVKLTGEQRGNPDAKPPVDEKYYRLTHDYLVTAVRNWLTTRQRATRRGRAELLLEERGSMWSNKHDTRLLPSLLEHLRIRLLTSPKRWTELESQMMQTALRKHSAWLTMSLLTLALLLYAGKQVNRFVVNERIRLLDERKLEVAQVETSRLIDGLLKAETSRVKDFINDLIPYRHLADSQLQTRFNASADGSSDKLHTAMALAHSNDASLQFLTAQLPQVSATQFLPVCQILLERPANLAELYFDMLQVETLSPRIKLQAACALAQFSPKHAVWNEPTLGEFVANQLTSLYPSELAPLREALKPVAEHLNPHLKKIHRDTQGDYQRQLFAAESLINYYANSPADLFEILLDADSRQFPLVMNALSGHKEYVLQRSADEVRETLVDAQPSDIYRRTNKHQATAAVVLYQLGQADKIWPLLTDSPKPDRRSYIIHWLADRGSNPSALLEHARVEKDSEILKAVLMALGEFPLEAFEAKQLAELVQLAQSIASDTTQAAMQSTVQWLLTALKKNSLAEQIEKKDFQEYLQLQQASRDQLAAQEKSVLVSEAEWLGTIRESKEFENSVIAGRITEYPLKDLAEIEKYTLKGDVDSTTAKPHLPATVIEGVFGNALQFDGTGPVRLRNKDQPILPKAFSCSCWMRMDNELQWGSLLSKMNPSDLRGFDVWIEGNVLGFHLKHNWINEESEDNSLIKAVSEKFVADNQWHHVLITVDGSGTASGVCMYVDGAAVNLRVLADSLAGSYETDAPLLIGGRPAQYHFQGDLSQIVMVDRALTSEEAGNFYVQSVLPLIAETDADMSPAQRALLDNLAHSAANVAREELERQVVLQHTKNLERINNAPRDWYYTEQGHRMHRIAAKTFRMGSMPGDSMSQQFEPVHTRHLNRTYGIAACEVTVAQWKSFLAENTVGPESHFRFVDIEKLDPLQPITNVTWFEAVQYCNWLSKKEGIPQAEWCYTHAPETGYTPAMKSKVQCWLSTGYRLPTQAEWEYACRAGTTSRFFFGYDESLLHKYAWFNYNSPDAPAIVAQLKPNGFGLFDMQGNAMEWCLDKHIYYPYDGEDSIDEPHEDDTIGSAQRSLRGAAFYDRPIHFGSGNRYAYEPANQLSSTGFRIAQTLIRDKN